MYIVYGGAFNPPTTSHIEIVELLLNKYKNAKVVILPVGNDYNKKELIDFKFRFEMLNLCFKNNKRVIISRLEDEIDYQGTLNSLNHLSLKYKNIYLATGADNVINFTKWIKYEELLSKYPLIIIKRNGIDVKVEMEKYQYLNIKYDIINYNTNVKSTLIRKDLEKYKNWLNEDIYQYILKNKLYGADNNV